jgi:D-3-phosphoglycerate dehydrogenase
VVDVPAAVALVVEGELRGVALDVFPQEPPPDLARLASVPGVLIAPHAAGFSVGLGRRITEGVLAGLSDWRSGRPQRFAVVPQSGAS